jgi:hypothetical protein
MSIAEGSLIETKRGLVEIEAPQLLGAMARTRKGWRRIIACERDGVENVCLIDVCGYRLWITPDHSIWAIGRGWTTIDSLRQREWAYVKVGKDRFLDKIIGPRFVAMPINIIYGGGPPMNVYHIIVDGEAECVANNIVCLA